MKYLKGRRKAYAELMWNSDLQREQQVCSYHFQAVAFLQQLTSYKNILDAFRRQPRPRPHRRPHEEGLRDPRVLRPEPARPHLRGPRARPVRLLLRLRLRRVDEGEPAAAQEDGALSHEPDEGQRR